MCDLTYLCLYNLLDIPSCLIYFISFPIHIQMYACIYITCTHTCSPTLTKINFYRSLHPKSLEALFKSPPASRPLGPLISEINSEQLDESIIYTDTNTTAANKNNDGPSMMDLILQAQAEAQTAQNAIKQKENKQSKPLGKRLIYYIDTYIDHILSLSLILTFFTFKVVDLRRVFSVHPPLPILLPPLLLQLRLVPLFPLHLPQLHNQHQIHLKK